MRACFILSLLALAGGQPVYTTKGPSNALPCALNSIGVVDQLMNSIIFIWQGVQRCGEGHDKAECSVDVSFAIEAVNNVIHLLTNAVHGCGTELSTKEQCNSAVMSLTSSMAAVAGTASGIAEHCPKTAVEPADGVGEALSGTEGKFPHGLAMCIVNSKALFWNVLHFGANANDAHERCAGAGSGSPACVNAVLRTLDSVAHMGEFVAGIVGHCTKPGDQKAKCASEVLGLLRGLNSMGRAGANVDTLCSLTSAERLYLEGKHDHPVEDQEGMPFPTIGLAALLPITAVLSFVLGRRMAKSRQPAYDPETVEFE